MNQLEYVIGAALRGMREQHTLMLLGEACLAHLLHLREERQSMHEPLSGHPTKCAEVHVAESGLPAPHVLPGDCIQTD
jgi:hypothetical protein